MLLTLLTPFLLASAQPAEAPAEAEPTTIEEPADTGDQGDEQAEPPAPADEPEEAEAPPAEEKKICRLRTTQDQFGRQKTVKSCRYEPR